MWLPRLAGTARFVEHGLMQIKSLSGRSLHSRPLFRFAFIHRFHRTRHCPSQRFADRGNHRSLGTLGPERLDHTP
jgi:hypothetical protein